MSGRNALEENFGFGGIDVLVNPSTPSAKSFVESIKTVHVSHQRRPISNVIPPKKKKKKDSTLRMKDITGLD